MMGLYRAIEAVVTDELNSVHVALPGRIEKYDSATQKADVKPLVMWVSRSPDGSKERPRPMPVVPCVPVVFPAAGGFSVTFPVEVGDTVLLVFASQSLDNWLFSDGRDTDPDDPRRHGLTDAIALPGLRPFTQALPSSTTSHLSLGKEGGARIHVKQNEVCLGEENPSELVAIASRVEKAINDLTTKFTAHVHMSVPNGGPTSPPTAQLPPGVEFDAKNPPEPMEVPSASNLGSSSVKVTP